MGTRLPTGRMDRKLLRIYLQDHLAAATTGRELVRRARGSNEDTHPYGPALARLADELEADRRALEGVLGDLGFGPDRPKIVAGWMAEKVGRLKPNGQLTGYSPLSRMVELEALSVGVLGKLSMWRTLVELTDEEPALDRDRLTRLAERAERQLETLDELRARAGRDALAR
jgi:hypothetical protein